MTKIDSGNVVAHVDGVVGGGWLRSCCVGWRMELEETFGGAGVPRCELIEYQLQLGVFYLVKE